MKIKSLPIRLESDEIAPQLLERLTRKHFTLFTLRPHLMKFQPDEVARIVQAGINLLAKSTTNIDHVLTLSTTQLYFASLSA